jgi:hypothetical protein
MGRFLRTIVGFVVGTICGSTFGAAMLGVPTYLDDTCGFMGCSRDWTPVAIYLGVILGATPGAVIGIATGVASLNKRMSAGAGAAVGLIILIILLWMGAFGDALLTGLGLLSIPAGALIGLIVNMILGLKSASKGDV